GIISCQVFEKELAHLLDAEERIVRIYALPTVENIGFNIFLKKRNIEFVRDLGDLEDDEELDAIVEIMPIGLHVDIQDLIIKRKERIDLLKEHCDSVLIFYGLCGDSMEKVFNRDDVRLIAPKDELSIVDDCICSVLGRAEYLRQLKNLGSLFLIPGFALHQEEMRKMVVGPKRQVDAMRMVLEAAGYRRTMLVDHDLWNDEERELASRYSAELGLPMECTRGSIDILLSCFKEAVDSVL
ncbi:MAG: DUF1638 domain-containing protein, partial [Candidatus Methanofastidiosa archaeon]|nr:DUF1638 domain-containing protein [Candidatus Methanofastidiosa archaeon]